MARDPDVAARTASLLLAIVGVATLGYGFAYVTTRAELTWILSNSMERIVLQVWPSLLLAILLYVASPTERGASAPMRAPASRPAAKPAPRRRRREGRR